MHEARQAAGEEHGHALWVASRGRPGVARELARELAAIGTDQDPVVHLALRVAPTAAFLDVDANLVRLLELAAERATDDATRARVLARLAGELLGDAAAAARRRRWPTRRSGWPGGPGTRARWPRSSTPGCTRCGTRPGRRPGSRPGPRSSTWPGRQGTTGANVTASSGGSWR
jgi:hypothetical protein